MQRLVRDPALTGDITISQLIREEDDDVEQVVRSMYDRRLRQMMRKNCENTVIPQGINSASYRRLY